MGLTHDKIKDPKSCDTLPLTVGMCHWAQCHKPKALRSTRLLQSPSCQIFVLPQSGTVRYALPGYSSLRHATTAVWHCALRSTWLLQSPSCHFRSLALFICIVFYIILKLRPPRTQKFLNMSGSRDIWKRRKNRKILRSGFFEKN